MVACHLAWLARAEGDLVEAAAHAREALVEARATGSRGWMAGSLRTAAGVRAAWGDFTRAARLFGAEAACRGGGPVEARVRQQHEADLAATRTGLGEAAFAAAWTAGQRLTLEEAVAEALAEEGDG